MKIKVNPDVSPEPPAAKSSPAPVVAVVKEAVGLHPGNQDVQSAGKIALWMLS